ncbi:NAD(+) diphosphatase [Luteococcus sp. OSA5]|uniref:NAD(+) diphosphatase n=1 Tax=Luteococcus sp. OSA5 TaxID=3401630 RepID=UPI003B43BBFB
MDTDESLAWALQPVLDRMPAARVDEDLLRALWQAPGTRMLTVDSRGRAEADPEGAPVTRHGDRYDPRRHVLLGRVGTTVWFCHRGPVAAGESLREGNLTGAWRELVTAATAVLAWHETAGFCPQCGGSTQMSHGGFQRTCTRCGSEVFPRTDPAMIVAVLDDRDRLLLAHNGNWPEGRVSILAGFVEAGESAEHAVVREVHEESGLQVSEARFLASQPWPYPRSMMLGFVARAQGEIRVDGQEIRSAQWYTPEELAEHQSAGLTLPSSGSIAGRIIARWRAGQLPAPEGVLRI